MAADRVDLSIERAQFARVARAITGDRESALEAVQEGFADALGNAGQWSGRGSLEGWVWRCVVNRARKARPHGVPVVMRERDGCHVEGDPELRACLSVLPERQRLVVFLRYFADLGYREIAETLQVDWSPDGRTLAYHCFSTERAQSEIFLMSRDGTGRRRLETGLIDVDWPTWSPDGRRIAFQASTPRDSTPAIYVIRLDGSGRVLVARHASMPDWSADGSTIAYGSPSGVKLVTPAGVEVTLHAIAPNGAPAWSPDGSSLAIGTRGGVYLVDKTGQHLRLATTNGGTGPFGAMRPAWYPGPRPPKARRTHTVSVPAASCKTCV